MRIAVWLVILSCPLAALGAGPRHLVMSEDSIPEIYTAPFHSTLLVLPKGEKLSTVEVGDSEDWPVTWLAGDHIVHIKRAGLKASKLTTNLNITTADDKTWSFTLLPAGEGHAADLKVFAERQAPARLFASAEAPAIAADVVPRAALLACHDDWGKQEVKWGVALLDATNRAKARLDPSTIALYRVTSRFHSAQFEMFSDGERTFFKSSKPLEVYEEGIADISEPVSTERQNGLIVVSRVLTKGSVKVSKKRFKFELQRKG